LVDLYSYILTVFPEIPTLPDYSSELASINEALLKKANVAELEALENNIFAADGGITDTFINAMMLQIGADSMNYELSHTITHADGTHSNYDIISNVFTINPVAGGENLIHFVYYWKDSSNNYHINWKISNGISVPLTAP
jgi:hypothetical protein